MTFESLQEALEQALSIRNEERKSLGLPPMKMSAFMKVVEEEEERRDDEWGALTRYPQKK
jgi:hypothetical protein